MAASGTVAVGGLEKCLHPPAAPPSPSEGLKVLTVRNDRITFATPPSHFSFFLIFLNCQASLQK